MKLFLHGEMGVGKSTLLRRMMQTCGERVPRGYTTHWAHAGRGADMIWLESWEHSVRIPFAEKGKTTNSADFSYTINEKETLSGIQTACFTKMKAPLVIDELGIIEFQSLSTVNLIQKAILLSNHAIVVVQNRALDQWKSIFHTMESHWQSVTIENRDNPLNRFGFDSSWLSV